MPRSQLALCASLLGALLLLLAAESRPLARRRQGGPEIDRLLEALQGTSLGARNHAAQRLFHLQDPRGNAGVLGETAAHRDPRRRAVGVWALTVVRPFGAKKLLLLRARDDIAFVRRAAVLGLGLIKPKGAAKVLRGLLTDPDASVRRAAVRALGRLGDVVGLRKALARPSLELQFLALRALGEQKSNVARQVLYQAAGRGKARVRAFAAQQLVLLADPRGARVLATLLGRTKDVGLRLQIVRYLADEDSKVGRRALEKLLRQPDQRLRSAAAEALAARLLRRNSAR